MPQLDKVRIAVVGAGWWAVRHHIPDLKANPAVELCGVSRLGEVELDFVKQEFGFEYASESVEELLDEARPDGVVVSSPHVLHYRHAAAALERGCHVMVEKPMATDMVEAAALVRLAASKARQILIPHGWNFTRYVPKAAELIRAGEIGEVRHLTCQMGSALMDLFNAEPMLETEGSIFRPPPSTWADPLRAGGYGWGQLSHALGAVFKVVPIDPVLVFCMMGLSEAKVDISDAAVVKLSNGATASVSGTAAIPKNIKPHLDLRIYGSKGYLFLDLEARRERLEVRRFDEKGEVFPMATDEGAYSTRATVERFVEICRGLDVDNEADGMVGLRTTEVLAAMYSSAQSGAPVEIRREQAPLA